MRTSRFPEVQIIGMIKEQEAGLPATGLYRKHGISPAGFHEPKARYGGVDGSNARRPTSRPAHSCAGRRRGF